MWDIATTYNIGDAVTFNGSSYIALLPSTGVTPAVGLNWSILASQGVQGLIGPEGPLGPQGLQGLVGPVGPIGPQGLQGLVGPEGPLGPQGLLGPAGPIGPQGLQGIQGLPGIAWKGVWDVATAYGIGDAVSFNGSSYIALLPSTGVTPVVGLNWSIMASQGIQGLIGPAGPIGPQGIQGLIGPEGPIGLTGLTGPAGPLGPQGIPGLLGPEGPIGLTGPAGPIGPQGLQGIPGVGGVLAAVSAIGTGGTVNSVTGLVCGSNSVLTGSSISHTAGTDTFTLSDAGLYRVEFSATPLAAVAAGFQVQLNGANVGQSFSVITVGSTIGGSVLLTTTGASTVRVIGTGISLSVGAGGSSVTITRLQ